MYEDWIKRTSSISMEPWKAFILHGYAGPLAGDGDLAGWLCRAVAWRAHFSLKIQLLAITPTSVMHLPFPKNHVLHLFFVSSIFEIFIFPNVCIASCISFLVGNACWHALPGRQVRVTKDPVLKFEYREPSFCNISCGRSQCGR